MAFTGPAGWMLILFLIGALLLIAILPFAVYRGYALLHATYTVERDGLKVRWGLRSEDIPLTEIIWVRPANDLQNPLRLPAFSVPGAILGRSTHQELGDVEFISSSISKLVIVASVDKTIILSPEDPEDFVYKFQRMIEMGSLYPITPHTAVPVAFIQQIISDKISRIMIIAMSALTLLLVITASLLIPLKPVVSLGYDLQGTLLPPVRSNRLLLLPIISVIFTIFNLVAGTFFFRRIETRMISYFVWAAGILTPLLLTLGVVLLVVKSA